MGCGCNKTVVQTEKYKPAQVDQSINQLVSSSSLTAIEQPTKSPYGLADVVKDKIAGTLEYASDELKDKRLQVCKRCPSLIKLPLGINGTGNCGKCSCFVDLKTSYKLSQCPDSKW